VSPFAALYVFGQLFQATTDPTNPAFWAYVLLQTGAVGALIYVTRAFIGQELTSGQALKDVRESNEKEKKDLRETHLQSLSDLKDSHARETAALRQQILDRDQVITRVLSERNQTQDKRDRDLEKLTAMIDSLQQTATLLQELLRKKET
jgi:biopolymer transport protein ExbB/TolQ